MSDTYFQDSTAVAISNSTRFRPYLFGGKRIFETMLVLLAIPIALPIIMMAVFLTKRDGESGLYSQIRVGKEGRLFRVWKIRTMVPNAEAELHKLIDSDPHIAAEWNTTQKLVSDPRITKLGRFFRKLSIDELPQFWNVLIGDMSLIGPRPFTVDQKGLYDDANIDRAYYKLRPGISGLWQVECRNNGDFLGRVDYDERYFENLTFRNDIGIAMKTLLVILRGTGH